MRDIAELVNVIQLTARVVRIIVTSTACTCTISLYNAHYSPIKG